jgi:hypothetical protein
MTRSLHVFGKRGRMEVSVLQLVMQNLPVE